MFRDSESISEYNSGNIVIWMILAFQAGVLNIGGLMACRSFVSHVTGFATLFGRELLTNDLSHAARVLAVPVFFLLGSVVSGLLVDIRLKLHKKPKYYLAFGAIFLCVLIIYVAGIRGYYGQFGQSVNESRDYALLALLCLVCGLQNGTITSVSKSVVRTTHLTGITTDLGIGIARLLNKNKLSHHQHSIDNDIKANYMRLGIILFFVFGSVVGAFAFHLLGFSAFAIPVLTSGGLTGSMIYYQLYKRHKQLHP